MTFLHAGLAIAGLLAIGVPILIHLLSRQRRRPIAWAAMRFLIEAFKKNRRRLQIEQLLLLAVRCLILAVLGFALARPLLENTSLLDAGGGRSVFIVLDDGMASGVRLDDGRTALEHHIEDAGAVIDALAAGDRVGLIRAARPARALVVPPSTDHAAVRDLIESLTPTETATDLGAALTMLRAAVDEQSAEGERSVAYLLSEFRGGSAPLDSPLPTALTDIDERVTLLAAPATDVAATNVQIVAVEPVRGMVLPDALDGSGQVTVRVARYGGELGRDVTRVRLTSARLGVVDPRIINWRPGQSLASVDFVVDFGDQGEALAGLSASIDNDALDADNTRHTVVELRRDIRVLLVHARDFGNDTVLERLEAGQWIRRALLPLESGDTAIDLIERDPAALGVADLRSSDAVILTRPDRVAADGWMLLREFVDTGGLLVVIPPGRSNVHQWTRDFTEALDLPWRLGIETVEYEAGLALADEQPDSEILRMISSDLSGLTRPVLAYRVLPVDDAATQAERVLVFRDGSPMLMMGSPGATPTDDDTSDAAPVRDADGLVVLMTVTPEAPMSTNLPTKPLMVPLFHEIVRQGLGLIRTTRRIGVGEQPVLNAGASAAAVRDADARTTRLTSAGRPEQHFERAGLYDVLDAAGQPVSLIAVNIDPGAGRTDVQGAAAVSDWLRKSGRWDTFEANDPAAALRSAESGSPLAGLLLAAVLALVLLETLLARRFSHAYRTTGDKSGSLSGGLRATMTDAAPDGAAAVRGGLGA